VRAVIHREERGFSIHLHLAAEFSEDYEGDEDGYAWFERFETVLKPRVVKAVFEALRSDPGWKVISAPRGMDPSVGVEIAVERAVGSPAKG
jgi:hypothetical protein